MSAEVLGILGGMGPAATLDLCARLTAAVDVARDQDHPRVIIDSNAKIPDRTAALLDGGDDPVPYLLDSVRTLLGAGADIIAIPCNTAHAYLPTIQEASPVPVLDMIDATVDATAAGGSVGLMATSGTVAISLYQRAYERRGREVITPDNEGQAAVMTAIRHVKAGDLRGAAVPFETAARDLAQRGATMLVLGCTELSLLNQHRRLDHTTIDPLDVLVDKILVRLDLPRSLPAGSATVLPMLRSLYDADTGRGARPKQGRERSMAETDRHTGFRIRREVLGDEHVDQAIAGTTPFSAPFQELITEVVWGRVWAGDTLDGRTRSCITLAVLAAIGCEEELAMHVRAAVRMGLTANEIAEVLLHTSMYAGVPRGNRAFAIAQTTLSDLGINLATPPAEGSDTP